ncbi:MAG: prepilin-type N-terminal cleavage/methylation domain-containing protein [Planctomycetes bacterium]|nr:prepilin-type N-terminal cleavage/methylation domain-containing protein [Planctomycetota bacterium]
MTALKQHQKGFTLLELLVVAAIIAIIAAIAIPSLLNARRAAWQSRAKGTLRSIGSSQLAYQGTNNKKFYGSFGALKDDLYIADGYSLGNMIENYSMSWTASNPYQGSGTGLDNGGIGNNAFTIVAYPRDDRPGYLNTFGVTEDQVVRVYNPEEETATRNLFDDMLNPRVNTWDPIL